MGYGRNRALSAWGVLALCRLACVGGFHLTPSHSTSSKAPLLPSLPHPLTYPHLQQRQPRYSRLWSAPPPTAGEEPGTSKKRGRLSKTREWASKVTGPAGLASYGLLNALYYTAAVSIAWVVTGGGGEASKAASIQAAAKRFLKVFVIAYAGSQVTKAPRLAGAVLLTPTMDRLLDQLQARLRLSTKWKAVGVFVTLLLGSTFATFGGLVLQGYLGLQAHGPARFLTLLPAAAMTVAACVGLFMARKPPPPPPGATTITTDDLAARGGADAAVMTKSRPAKGVPPPPNPNVHGWDQSPAYLRGKWEVTSVSKTAEGYDDIIDVARQDVRAMVLRRDTAMRLVDGGGSTETEEGGLMAAAFTHKKNLTCLGWEFTPANRRMVVEILVPDRDVVLRFSGEVKRRPKHWTRAHGVLRVRPVGEGGKRASHRAIPSTDPKWPKVAEFTMERDMEPPQKLSKWEQLLIWARLEAPRFKTTTKAGRRAAAYMQGSIENREKWNALALKFELWKYFDTPSPEKKEQRQGRQGELEQKE